MKVHDASVNIVRADESLQHPPAPCSSTGQHFECAQPVPERIADKGTRNAYTFFSLHVAVGSARPRRGLRAL